MSRAYLDHAATSPLLPEALEAMQPWLGPGRAANASSLHAEGRAARAAIDEARAELAGALAVEEDEILFTGSGTESDNLALRGLTWAFDEPPHVVTTAVEHEAVLRTLRWLERRGDCELAVVAPDRRGRVAAESVLEALRPHTALVSVMAVNNEVGVVQPVAELAGLLAERGIRLHVDAVQAPGRWPVPEADLVSLSGHKAGGPAGCGVLVARRGLKLQPVATGGGQEEGLRPGTESVAAIVGTARALRLAIESTATRAARLAELGGALEAGLRRIEGVEIVGDGAERAPGIVSAAFRGAEAATLVRVLDLHGVAASAGSACTSGSTRPSHVLTSMGLAPEAARSTLRLSLGPTTGPGDVERALSVVATALDAARQVVRS